MKLAVIGDPVAHSKSPILHQAFLREASIAGSYEALRVSAAEVGSALTQLARDGYLGLNVTTPLKEAVLAFVGGRDALVTAIGAANTLTYDRNARSWLASNTDGIGAVRAMQEALGYPPAGARILVLGAGPTGRAAILAFQAAGAHVTLWNRSLDKAMLLAAQFGARIYSPAEQLFHGCFSSLPPGAEIDTHVAATIAQALAVVDANYGTRATLGTFLGRPVHTGESMLAAQARASFNLWCDFIRTVDGDQASHVRGEREI